jgi:hypothetical protein
MREEPCREVPLGRLRLRSWPTGCRVIGYHDRPKRGIMSCDCRGCGARCRADRVAAASWSLPETAGCV